MKKYFTILFILLAAINTNAQPKTLVQDKENLFTIDEITRFNIPSIDLVIVQKDKTNYSKSLKYLQSL